MSNEQPRPSANGVAILPAVIIGGAIMIALVGTLVPMLIGLEGMPAWIMRLVFYAVAVIDIAIAFWLRARLHRARHSDRTVQRQ